MLEIGVRVNLESPETFLLVKESLTRIGVASRKDKKLYQSVHLLHKRGEYFLCHFKELFILDGKQSSFSEEDRLRRNLIAFLLNDWGLVSIVNMGDVEERAAAGTVKVLSFKDKENWTLSSKYTLGNGR
jgi:hypothetical protein